MLNVAFFGRNFHRFSRSADFFVSQLKCWFDVDVYYLDSDPNIHLGQAELETLIEGYDLAVVWQYETITIALSTLGVKVVNVSMWDGVSARTDLFWTRISSVPNIAFCAALSDKLEQSGCNDIFNIKFAPKPIQIKLKMNKEVKVLLWERDPDCVSAMQVVEWLGGLPNIVFNFHDLSVDAQQRVLIRFPHLRPFIKFSKKSDDAGYYLSILSGSDIYIAPRQTEGIGMAFLEAMAHGKCVVARDKPTMSEYISHGKNGLLYTNTIQELRPELVHSRFHAFGFEAMRSIRDLRSSYENSIGNLRTFLIKAAERSAVHGLKSEVAEYVYRIGLASVDDGLSVLEIQK